MKKNVLFKKSRQGILEFHPEHVSLLHQIIIRRAWIGLCLHLSAIWKFSKGFASSFVRSMESWKIKRKETLRSRGRWFIFTLSLMWRDGEIGGLNDFSSSPGSLEKRSLSFVRLKIKIYIYTYIHTCIHIYMKSSVWRALRRETLSHIESMRPL